MNTFMENVGTLCLSIFQMIKMTKPYRLKYAGSRGVGAVVTLPSDPRKGVCSACYKSKHEGEIKNTALHHWWYAYAPKTVKKDPKLALENTSELCYYCHQLADSLRALLYAKPERVGKVVKLLKGEYRIRFIKVMECMVDYMQKTENNISPLANKVLQMVKDG